MNDEITISDAISEGIRLAHDAVRDLQSDWSLSRRDAVAEALRTIDLPESEDDAWIMSPYGSQEEAVRDAARSELWCLLRAARTAAAAALIAAAEEVQP